MRSLSGLSRKFYGHKTEAMKGGGFSKIKLTRPFSESLFHQKCRRVRQDCLSMTDSTKVQLTLEDESDGETRDYDRAEESETGQGKGQEV